MKIIITTPDFSLHGGIRVILEWANRLSEWHEVYLYNLKQDKCTWFDILPQVKMLSKDDFSFADCMIITSPHSIHLAKHPSAPEKIFLFMQMAEHMFRPNDYEWYKKCKAFYAAPYPMFSISKWNKDLLEHCFGRTHHTYLISNGVNLNHFPISTASKDGRTVLVEGWNTSNPTKDYNAISLKVARRLKSDGYNIIAYAANPPQTFKDALHEFHLKPSLQLMNRLYERATILLKATKYDARSCSPMEAMTKGTVTARAIIQGDDDLIHESNCLRCDYGEADELYENAKQLLKDQYNRNRLSNNCRDYVQRCADWNSWMMTVENILTDRRYPFIQ